MFIIVKLSEDENKSRRKRKQAPFLCERTDIDFHRYFFTVTVKSKKGRYDKRAFERYTGKLSGSLVFPDTKPPENRRLAMRRLLNAAPDFLRKDQSHSPLKSLCICDPDGFGTNLTEGLLPLTAFLHIICTDRERYTETAEQLFSKYGVPLTVSEKWNKSAERCDLVITCSLAEIPHSFKGKIFTCDTRSTHPASVYTAKGTVLPYRFEKLRPPCM